MKYYDISVPLSPTAAVWPGHTPFSREEKKTSAIVSTLTMNSHMGTHIDAPKHFLFSKGGIDTIAMDSLIGKFVVFAMNSKDQITLADVKKLVIKSGFRVLFKTRNSAFITKQKFNPNYVSLSLEAAQYLVSKKIKLVGIDYFGVEAKGSPGHLVHKLLLSKNIPIAEGLNLSKIKSGTYSGAILPLLIAKGDGAPARAVLWK